MMVWERIKHDGIYQLIASEGDVTVIESNLDVTDGKCKEIWDEIKKAYPNATGYRSFCAAYREGAEEFGEYAGRVERRYKTYWGKRAR